MAIRLRNINGRIVALCANEFQEQEDDKYLDDAEHEALIAKFRLETFGECQNVVYSDTWKLMDSQSRNPEDWCSEEHQNVWRKVRHLL